MGQNIILTGFMGTGKTTVGRLISAEINYNFVDTDVYIEDKSGLTIARIFAELGEDAFREMEQAAANALADKQNMVVATGGGMMLDPYNAAVLGETGQIFCLAASSEEILARVLSDPKRIERPLLKVPNPAQRIADLLAERREQYGQFTQIPTTNRTPHEVAQLILDARHTPKQVI